MKIHKLIYLTIFAVLFTNCASAKNLRSMFQDREASLYAINMRTFSAVDLNGDDIIDKYLGEETGTFTKGAERLDEIKDLGVNTIYILPITKTGKLKALGTAGSLYAMDSFDKIDTQLDDRENTLDVKEEAKFFINKAHEKGLNVIIDLPSCGSYDLSLERPDLFVKDKNNKTVTPADWSDVRLFKTQKSKNVLNDEIINEYKKFMDLMLEIKADGIRADVAAMKPLGFWKALIDYTREKDSNFFFLAEASRTWENPSKKYAPYLTVEELLSEGFDGYYGEYSNFPEIKKPKEFKKQIEKERKFLNKFKGKSVIGNFATHDQLSPILNGGEDYSKMIIWLSATLPLNPYFLDGFTTGDNYIYKYENKKAQYTATDDDYYFVHRGKMDIFNFSRRPGGGNLTLREELKMALKFRYWAKEILKTGKIKFLKTNNKNVVAFIRQNNENFVLVAFNLDKKNAHKASLSVPKLNSSSIVTVIKNNGKEPLRKRRKMTLNLNPYEIQVYIVTKK